MDPGAARGLAPAGSARSAAPRRTTIYRADVEARARRYELQPLRWPDPFPADTEWAMLAATYAKQIGRGVAFSLAAFRQAFAGGRDLGDRDSVLIAAAACEMHPAALIRAPSSARSPRAWTRRPPRPAAAGVLDVPAVRDRRPRLPRRPRARARRGGALRHEGQPRVRAAACARPAAARRCCAARAQTDHVEVLEIATGEIALFWDTEPAQTGRLARGLRADLAALERRRVPREVAALAGGVSELRRRMQSGEPLLGTFLDLGSALAVEITAGAGFDWLVVDLEHGAGGREATLAQLQAARAPVIVRVPSADSEEAGWVLDHGAAGRALPACAGRPRGGPGGGRHALRAPPTG